MDQRPEAEIPQRRSKNTSEGHSVVFGACADDSHFTSLKNHDYVPKHYSAEDRAKARDEQQGRVQDMNTKHFVFGHHPQTMLSELRGTLLPPTREVLLSRAIRPIGGPNNKGASNLFVSDKDRSDWGTNMVSTNRQDFRFDGATHGTSQEVRSDTIKHIKQMRSSHFDIGHDRSEWASTVRSDYVHKPEGRAESVPPKGSSVPLSDPRDPRRGDAYYSVNRGEYGQGVGSVSPPPTGRALPHIRELQRTHMVLGYHARELMTENKGQFKRPQFIPAADTGRPGPPTFTPTPLHGKSPARKTPKKPAA